MSVDVPDDARAEASVLRTMVLLATLSTAAECWTAVAERRAGYDPSAQEDAGVVRPRLQASVRTLDGALRRLQQHLVYMRHRREAYLPALVRRFEIMMTVWRVARSLKEIHQRLMSLYPAVSEVLVEEARCLQDAAAALLEAEAERFPVLLTPFLARSRAFTTHLHRVLDPAP